MNKIKIIFLITAVLTLTGCSGLTPRAGAGVGVGVGLDLTKKMPIRPYIGAGVGGGLFKFF